MKDLSKAFIGFIVVEIILVKINLISHLFLGCVAKQELTSRAYEQEYYTIKASLGSYFEFKISKYEEKNENENKILFNLPMN